LTLCGAVLSGLVCAASPLPQLDTTSAGGAKANPEKCLQLQEDFDIDLPDDLISRRWSFRLSLIPVIPTFMF